MAFVINGEEIIFGRTVYRFIRKHRDYRNYLDVSKWKIDYKREYDLAFESRDKNYNLDCISWNTIRINDQLVILGQQNQNDEYIARFELSADEKTMHGYPIDHTRNPKQKPDADILRKLYDDNKISKRELYKILQGKKI